MAKNSMTGLLTISDRGLAAKEIGRVTYSELSAWQKRAVDAGAVRRCEWHHTGAAANPTSFYDLEDFAALDANDYPVVKKEAVPQADTSRLKIYITFDRMIGGYTRKARSKFETVTTDGSVDIRKSDNCIIGSQGRRLSSNNKQLRLEYLPPRGRKWREITRKEAVDIGYTFG